MPPPLPPYGMGGNPWALVQLYGHKPFEGDPRLAGGGPRPPATFLGAGPYWLARLTIVGFIRSGQTTFEEFEIRGTGTDGRGYMFRWAEIYP